jgi:hypothetical protein
MNRLAVIANLKRGAEKEAEELVEKGPPFDPSGLGFERHSVYLAGGHALFVFEGGRLDQLMQSVVTDPTSIAAFREWERLIAVCLAWPERRTTGSARAAGPMAGANSSVAGGRQRRYGG